MWARKAPSSLQLLIFQILDIFCWFCLAGSVWLDFNVKIILSPIWAIRDALKRVFDLIYALISSIVGMTLHATLLCLFFLVQWTAPLLLKLVVVGFRTTYRAVSYTVTTIRQSFLLDLVRTFFRWLRGKLTQVSREMESDLERIDKTRSAFAVHHLTTSDGWRLALVNHPPAASACRRRYPVMLVHGLSANNKAYRMRGRHSLACTLAARGFDVWALELRGAGLSEHPPMFGIGGEKRYNWTFDDYITKDCPAAVRYILEYTKQAKLHWIGHSMGGICLFAYLALARHGLIADPNIDESQIMSGIAVGSSLNYYISGGSIFHKVKPFFPLLGLIPDRLGLPGNWLYWLVHRFLGYFPNPLEKVMLHQSNCKPEDIRSLFRSGFATISPPLLLQLLSAVKKRGLTSAAPSHSDAHINYYDRLFHMDPVDVPLLALAGDFDQICPADAVLHTLERVRSTAQKKYRCFGPDFGEQDHYGHFDLLMGRRAHEEVFPVIVDWLLDHEPEEERSALHTPNRCASPTSNNAATTPSYSWSSQGLSHLSPLRALPPPAVPINQRVLSLLESWKQEDNDLEAERTPTRDTCLSDSLSVDSCDERSVDRSPSRALSASGREERPVEVWTSEHGWSTPRSVSHSASLASLPLSPTPLFPQQQLQTMLFQPQSSSSSSSSPHPQQYISHSFSQPASLRSRSRPLSPCDATRLPSSSSDRNSGLVSHSHSRSGSVRNGNNGSSNGNVHSNSAPQGLTLHHSSSSPSSPSSNPTLLPTTTTIATHSAASDRGSSGAWDSLSDHDLTPC